MNKNKNGAQIAGEIVELARKWISSNPNIPLKDDGSVNVTELARKLGTDRKRFSTNLKLKETVNEYLKNIGHPCIGVVTSKGVIADKTVADLRRENKRLSERIIVMQSSFRTVNKENESLKKEIDELRSKLDLQSFDSQIILEYGRVPR